MEEMPSNVDKSCTDIVSLVDNAMTNSDGLNDIDNIGESALMVCNIFPAVMSHI